MPGTQPARPQSKLRAGSRRRQPHGAPWLPSEHRTRSRTGECSAMFRLFRTTRNCAGFLKRHHLFRMLRQDAVSRAHDLVAGRGRPPDIEATTRSCAETPAITVARSASRREIDSRSLGAPPLRSAAAPGRVVMVSPACTSSSCQWQSRVIGHCITFMDWQARGEAVYPAQSRGAGSVVVRWRVSRRSRCGSIGFARRRTSVSVRASARIEMVSIVARRRVTSEHPASIGRFQAWRNIAAPEVRLPLRMCCSA